VQPLQFQPDKREVSSVPIDVHNAVVEELEKTQSELMRCRQKVAHLLKERDEK